MMKFFVIKACLVFLLFGSLVKDVKISVEAQPPPPAPCNIPSTLASAAVALNATGAAGCIIRPIGGSATITPSPSSTCCTLLDTFFREAVQAQANGVSCQCIIKTLTDMGLVLGLRLTINLGSAVTSCSLPINSISSLQACLPA